MRLSELTAGRQNNLDALRLMAAFLVVLSHTFYLLGRAEPHAPFFPSASLGTLGVDIFFIISGFLITQSFLRQSPGRFLWARLLRIFPALILVVLASVFVIGPLRTAAQSYWQDGQTYHYLLNATLLDYTRTLPGVFHGEGVNNSLWTLRYEFLCYLLVLAVGLLGALRDRRLVLGMFVLSLVLNSLGLGADTGVWEVLSVQQFLWLFAFFGAGMTAYLYREYLDLSPRVFLFVLALLAIGSCRGGFSQAITVFLLAYAVLFLAYTPQVKLGWLTRYGDFSYGVYLWAWPVVSLYVDLWGPGANPWLLFLGAGGAAYLLGAASWHLLEKRALGLKGRMPHLAFWKSRALRARPPLPGG